MDVLVAHGPCVGGKNKTQFDKAVAFWKEVATDVHARPDVIVPLVSLADTNLRFGNVNTPSIGDRFPSEENEAAEELHVLLQTNAVALPSTFFHHHSGDDITWVDESCRESGLVFVGIPIAWLPAVRNSTVDESVDKFNATPDHYTPVVQVELKMLGEGTGLQRRKPVFDRRQLGNVEHARGFVQAVSMTQQPSWKLDSHSHCPYIVDGLQNRLQNTFHFSSGRRSKASVRMNWNSCPRKDKFH